MKKMIVILATLALMSGSAQACVADVGTATTAVYVRSMDGEVVGSLAKGDKVVVTGSKGGWKTVRIDGSDYRIFGEYLSVESDVELDLVKTVDKVRKSKSGGKKQVTNKSKHKIKGSAFEVVYFW